jgi:ribosomal protein S27AE
MSEYLSLEDLIIGYSETGYEEAVVKLLKDKGITVEDFEHVGKCDSECPNCGEENFSIWQRNIGLIKNNEMITLDLDKADENFDFAIYFCNNCGKWTTYIE